MNKEGKQTWYFDWDSMSWKSNDYFHDTLVGTSDVDTISGLGGNDTLWGGTGDDKMYGGAGDDTIKPGDPNIDITWNWGQDYAYGGDGIDTLDFRKTTGDVHLYGEGDNDIIYSGSGNDHLFGGAGLDWIEGGDGNDKISGGDYIDYLFGNAGHDDLWGDAGNDVLDGGSGLDDLIGGAGRDYLTGGSGYDMFWFEIPDGWTDSKVSDPDHILDFNGADDWINMPVAGTTSSNIFQTSNYIEAQMGGFAGYGYDVARNWAENHITGNVRYAFVSDGINGYLFGDLNGNGTVETGIVLEGVTSITQFDYSNIM